MTTRTIANLLVWAAVGAVGQTTAPLPPFEVASVKAAAPEALPASRSGGADSRMTGGPGQSVARPEFEVASMKLAARYDKPGGAYRDEGGPGTASPGRWTCANMPLLGLITKAWNLNIRQISIPSPADGARYDILANVPAGASRDDFDLMIQRLLVERLGLVVHKEQKEMNVQELIVAKGGLKMKAAAPADAPSAAPRLPRDKGGNLQTPPGRPMLVGPTAFAEGLLYVGRMQGIDDLARALSGRQAEMVIDKTGLTGKYDFNLRFFPTITAQMALRNAADAAPGAAVPEPSDSWPPLKAALLEQLGLQLQPARVAIDILVVDRFNKTPAEN